jgi:hypothetical protein
MRQEKKELNLINFFLFFFFGCFRSKKFCPIVENGAQDTDVIPLGVFPAKGKTP